MPYLCSEAGRNGQENFLTPASMDSTGNSEMFATEEILRAALSDAAADGVSTVRRVITRPGHLGDSGDGPPLACRLTRLRGKPRSHRKVPERKRADTFECAPLCHAEEKAQAITRNFRQEICSLVRVRA